MTICSCCRGYSTSSSVPDNGRSPRGERGLKQSEVLESIMDGSRSPRGERGLKPRMYPAAYEATRRSPRGERGLKRTRR